MIKLSSINQTWSAQELSQWTESYRRALPDGERILIALDHPFHQLAALYAGLIEGRRVLSASPNSTEQEIKGLDRLFRPEAKLDKLTSCCQQELSKNLIPNKGLLGIATSGSSGKAKIVLHHPSSLMASAKASCDFYQLTQEDILANPLPLHHIGGIMPFWRALSCAGQLFLPEDKWQDACSESASHISLVPTQLLYLLEKNFDWSSFSSVIMGAQALDPKLLQKALYAGAPISVSYGSSESAAQLSATPANTDPQGSVGALLGAREVKILNDRVCFRGEAMLWGYQDGEHDLFPFDDEGYFHTQDMGQFDSQGRLYILGRADHIFKCGGENVNPHLLESSLNKELSLRQCMVVPIPDNQFGHLPAAFITPFDLETIDLVKAFNKSSPSHLKIRHVCGDFPQSSNIKVSRTYAAQKMKDKITKWNLHRLAPAVANKPDLVFLHGFMGNSHSLESLALLFKDDFNIWGLDLPYHGKHIDTEYEDWNHIIDELAFILMRFSKLWIYGYSMGGRLALGLKSRYPKLAKYFIIEGAHPGLSNQEDKNQRKQFELDIIHKMKNFDHFISEWYQLPIFALKQKQILELSRQVAKTPELYSKALNHYGLSKQPNLLTETSAKEIVFLVGEGDQKYRSLYPNALIIPKSGHKASFEQPQSVYRLICEHIVQNSWN